MDKNIEDVNRTTSDRTGIVGKAEVFFRTFRQFAFVVMMGPILLIGILTIGLSLTPGVLLFKIANSLTQDFNISINVVALGVALGAGFILYGITIVFVAPFFNFIMPFRVKPCRGPWFSLSSIPWYYHNGLTYIVRYTFLDLLTPSPLNILFYRLMGMKIGKGVVINTTNISDVCLITLDDYVMLGGSATIFAHYGMKGYLVIDKVHIKEKANIGHGALIMGDVVIGKKARVLPNAVVLPGARVSDEASVPDIEDSIYITKEKDKEEEKQLKVVDE